MSTEARNNETLVNFLSAIDLFSVFNSEELESIAASGEIKTYNFGETVLESGSDGRGVYIVRSGMVRLFSVDQGKEISMGIRKEGEVFAELALLRNYRLDFSVRASAKTEILFFPRDVVARILNQNQAAQRFIKSYAAINAAGGFMTRLFDLRGKVDKAELEGIIRSVGIKQVRAQEVVLEQGSVQDRRLYVIRQGKVSILYKENNNEYPLATLDQGEVFGEKACVFHQRQPASVIADTNAVLLVLSQDTVNFILGRNPKLKEVLEERIRFAERELQRQKKLAERRKNPVLLDLWSKPGYGEKLIKRFPLVEQAEEMDCGAACLSMICKYYGIPMTLGKLREMANVSTEGATLESLSRVGESLGFMTRGVKCTYLSMMGFDLPFIAHWKGYHYIIVYGVSKSHVRVADPARGFVKMNIDEFEQGWTGTCLLFAPGTDMAQLAATQSPWVRFINYLKPHKRVLLHMVMATLVIEMLGVIPPVIVQNVLDHVVVHQSYSLLNLLIVGLILTHVFTQLTTVMRAFLSNFMIRNLDFAMMSAFLKHTLSLPLSFYIQRRTGDIFARFQENQTLRQFLTESTIITLLNILMIFIYFAVMLAYNIKMTLLLVAFGVPIAVLTFIITPRIKNYARLDFDASTDAESVLMETISGVETVKAMGIERPMRMKWEKKYAKLLDIRYRSQRFEAFVGLTSQLLNAATTIVILWIGANLVLSQELTIGQLIAFNMLMGSVMAPLMGLIDMWDELHEAGVAMERIGDVLDLEPEQDPRLLQSRIMLPDIQGAIRFENVYFRYRSKETPYVLKDISFAINPGELIAIVGQSGSGKTTLAKLLVGFFPPTEGKIFVDEYDLNLVDKQYFRSQIGCVLQNNLLFSGSIAENVALGDDNPDRRRVIEVAKLADAHGFIGNMPLGYEQIVGERGVGLSEGQIQRICIARALYHDPRLLVFDEATSALDSQSESNILKNMRQILQGRTAVVIAHRLSTILNADKILVLYDGSIIEEGPHQELVNKQGMYYQLVQKQIAGIA